MILVLVREHFLSNLEPMCIYIRDYFHQIQKKNMTAQRRQITPRLCGSVKIRNQLIEILAQLDFLPSTIG